MDPTDTGLFRLAERRLGWIDQRQEVLAQNIANANTPGYKARDLSPFQASLAQQDVTLAPTEGVSLPGSAATTHGREVRADSKTPNGNTVEMEDQLGKMANTASDQELVTSLYHKYQGLFSLVLGKS